MTWSSRWFLVLGLAVACTGPELGEETLALGIDPAECVANNAGPGGGDHRVGICHSTGSETNPYVYIRVSEQGCYRGHVHHPEDFRSEDPLCRVLCPQSETPQCTNLPPSRGAPSGDLMH
jgi:hypothetical protein